MNDVKPYLQLMEIYNQLPCACVTVDVDGMILNVNDTFLNFTGYDREEIIKRIRLEKLYTPIGKKSIDPQESIKLNLNGNSKILNVNLITKTKEMIPCTISSIVIKEELTEIHHYTFIDIRGTEVSKKFILEEATKLLNSEYKLNKLTSEMQKMSVTIALEIQNPLRNILGLITLLKQNYTDAFNVTGLKFLDHIADSGEKMRHQFDALLNNSTNGKSVIDKKYVDLNVIVADVKLKLSNLIEKNRVNIQIPEPLPSIFGIGDDLWLLFNNLIKNAIQFKQETTSPNIIISFVEAEFLYHFTIEDNGIGIVEEYHQKIFEEYFHLDPNGDDCSGRGLPESRQIVEKHNGTIGVLSNANKGCTIYFSLEK